MAIGTDSAIEFFGDPDALGTSSAAVAIDAFSISGDLSTWVNDDDAIMAKVVLKVTFSVAPDANSSINLYIRPLDIDGTNDSPVPDANFQHVSVGSFPVNDVTVLQPIILVISLLGASFSSSQNYEFYVENKTGQIMPAGWDLIVKPTAIGPQA